MPTIECACGRRLAYRVEQVGRTARCPACGASVQSPGEKPPQTELELDLAETGLDESEYALAATPPLLPPPAEEVAAPAPSSEPFTPLPAGGTFRELLSGAFRYPLQQDSIAALITGLIICVVAHYIVLGLGCFPVLGELARMAAYISLTGYFTGYAMSVMESSAKGDKAPPDLPEFDWESIQRPLIIAALIGLPALGLYFFYLFLADNPGLLIGWALLLPGLIYLPMALLSAALDRSSAGLGPARVFRAMNLVAEEYAVICALVLLAGVLESVGGGVFYLVPVLGYIVQQAICFYLLFVAARLLGLLVRTRPERLGWMAE